MKNTLMCEVDDDGMVVRFTFEAISPNDVTVPDVHRRKVVRAMRTAQEAASDAYYDAMGGT